MRCRTLAFFTVVLVSSFAWGQNPAPAPSSAAAQSGSQQSGSQQSMPGMDMSHHDMSGMSNSNAPNSNGSNSNASDSSMKDMPMGSDKDADSDTSAHVMHSMEGHMDMGPHMKMTAVRQPQAGDAERAQKIVDAARKAGEKYLDYHVALDEGFKIFHPEIPQKVYHFTSGRYAIEALWNFNPEHPTSLLYEKHGDGYKLVGVMYTAPKRFNEDDLNQRIPLSFGQWHEHVNFCAPPLSMSREEKREAYLGHNAKFGPNGSINTQDACKAAGGWFIPVVFNWMVHVYPFEKDQASIWSVERQHAD